MTLDYGAFLAAKASIAEPSGLPCDPDEVHPLLKPHQRDAVVWAVRGGRRAVFASFGPLQFDIVDRLIEQFSMPGETVFDPFMGIGTVPYCAVKAGRRGVGIELSAGYYRDAAFYVEAAARDASMPTLFDLVEATA